MNLIIIINGSGTSGKDTLVKLVDKNVDNTFVYTISSVDVIKQAAHMLGCGQYKTDNDREFLHQLKMLASKHYNHSFNYMMEKYEWYNNVYKSNNVLVNNIIGFFHIREPEEIEKFKWALIDKGAKVLTLLVHRDNIEQFTNDADKNVEEYIYDYVIYNNGTLDEFRDNIVKLFDKIIKENE